MKIGYMTISLQKNIPLAISSTTLAFTVKLSPAIECWTSSRLRVLTWSKNKEPYIIFFNDKRFRLTGYLERIVGYPYLLWEIHAASRMLWLFFLSCFEHYMPCKSRICHRYLLCDLFDDYSVCVMLKTE